jgi:hypothetical protein
MLPELEEGDDIVFIRGNRIIAKMHPLFPGKADAEFIAASRTTLPLLAQAVLDLSNGIRSLEIANAESTRMLIEASDEIAALKELTGSTYCAFCGQRFVLDGTAAELVSEHILTCEKHPMRKVEQAVIDQAAEIERLRAVVDKFACEAEFYSSDFHDDYAAGVMDILADLARKALIPPEDAA